MFSSSSLVAHLLTILLATHCLFCVKTHDDDTSQNSGSSRRSPHTSSLSSSPIVIKNAVFGKFYNGTVSSDKSVIYEYSYNHSKGSIIRVHTISVPSNKETDSDFPVLIVIKQQKAVQSWQLPLPISYSYSFSSVSRFLCPEAQDENITLPLGIELNTFSTTNASYRLHTEILTNFTVSTWFKYNVYVSPSTPQYYKYTFQEAETLSVTLKVKSEQKSCAFVSIQGAKCPVADLQSNVASTGIVETILTQGAITILRPSDDDSVYIVFVVSPSDSECTQVTGDSPLTGASSRMKHIQFHIEGHIGDSVYYYAIFAGFGYSLMFYISFAVIIGLYTIKRRKNDEERQERNDKLKQDVLLGKTSTRSYGSIPARELQSNAASASTSHSDSSDEVPPPERADSLIEDADYLDDADEIKDVYRAKINLTVADMAKKSHKSLGKKYRMYPWNLVTLALFYALPVVQLVLTYQVALNTSGDEDMCYYNFFCSRRLGLIHNFNNVFSNLGYILLGILFLLITRRRQRKVQSLPQEIQENYGIPQHLGLFYAMGWALITEGVMSGCYHVCPSYVNFQFDTSFMYILAGLLMLRLFQSRHPDINVNAHVAFLSLAAVIGIAVIGVVYNTKAFWFVFCVVHVLVVLFGSLQIYYVGRFKFNKTLFVNLYQYVRTQCCRFAKPQHVSRLVLLSLLNMSNWALSLYGLLTTPRDFASYLLAIFIVNFMIYCFFYIVMKFIHKERPSWPSIVYGAAAAVFWGPALYFFTDSLTSWQLTPAESRDLNAPCLILNFFDGHDIWHFLSAGALFSSFLMIFHIDDDLIYKPRNEIPVF